MAIGLCFHYLYVMVNFIEILQGIKERNYVYTTHGTSALQYRNKNTMKNALIRITFLAPTHRRFKYLK